MMQQLSSAGTMLAICAIWGGIALSIITIFVTLRAHRTFVRAAVVSTLLGSVYIVATNMIAHGTSLAGALWVLGAVTMMAPALPFLSLIDTLPDSYPYIVYGMVAIWAVRSFWELLVGIRALFARS